MKLVKQVNLLEDKKLIFKLNLGVIPLFLLFYVMFLTLANGFNSNQSGSLMSVNFRALVLLLALLVIHELIHGLFFKLFKPESEVKFGFKNGMAYATSPGSRYKKIQFVIILLAPFVLITTGLCIMVAFQLMLVESFAIVAALHGAGCIGDFYFVYLISKTSKDTYVEDTEKGIDFYSN